jgi:lipoprotein-anchoring transpeptidase ErfK/SrfK
LVPGTQEAPSGPRIEDVDPAEPVPDRFRRQTVDYVTTQPAGTIVIDTPNTYLYFVLGNNKTVRYRIAVRREAFTWPGTERITGKKHCADSRPPTEMIQRQPYLPRFMAGGPGNPLGARTMYLGGTVYRIHGTNEPQTIGKFVSSGCFRMLNNDVEDLYDRAKVGTKVVILPKPTSAVQASAANGGGMPAAGPVATPR